MFDDISRYLTEKYFGLLWGCHILLGTPQMEPQKSNFSTAQARVPVFFDISRYLTDKYFDKVWEYLTKNSPHPNKPHKIQFFEWLKLGS